MRTTTSPELTISNATVGELAGVAESGTALALSALHSTRLAIARWTGGIHAPRMEFAGSVRISPQARWYAQANLGFQEWINQGGFTQTADTAEVCANSEQVNACLR